MKKILIAILMTITITIQAQDFRGVPWGAGQSDIIEVEGKPSKTDTVSGLEVLVYSDVRLTFLNQSHANVDVVYISVDNKLVRAKYILDEYVSETDSYLDYLQYFEEALEANYGEPKETIDDWADSESRIFIVPQKSRWGHYLYMGHVKFYRKYEDEYVSVSLALWKDDREIRLELNYNSKEFGHLEENSALSRVKRDF